MARNRLCRSVPGFSWRRESAGGQASPPQYLLDWYCKRRKRSNAGVPGAKPPAKLTYSLPLPAGKGVGGMGARKHTEGRDSRRPKRQAPPCAPPTPPPPRRRGQAPRWTRGLLPCSDAPSGSARGCKGRSPLHEITIVSPFPGGEGGRGDGGRKEAEGKVSRRQKRQAPLPPCPPKKTTPLADLHRNPITHCASCTTAREKSKKIPKTFRQTR